MENIEIFVNFCEAYGVPRTSLFQTVDLFEGRNMAQVLSCLQQLGSEVRSFLIALLGVSTSLSDAAKSLLQQSCRSAVCVLCV